MNTRVFKVGTCGLGVNHESGERGEDGNDDWLLGRVHHLDREAAFRVRLSQPRRYEYAQVWCTIVLKWKDSKVVTGNSSMWGTHPNNLFTPSRYAKGFGGVGDGADALQV